MSGPKDFSLRRPVVSGTFYPADPRQCRQAAETLLSAGANSSPAAELPSFEFAATLRACGAIVPHAGWMCSGAIAGQAVAQLARWTREAPPDVVVVFGAVHTPIQIERAAFDPHAAWEVPTGNSVAAEDLARELGGLSQHFTTDDRLHRREHAIEVELPLIQLAWPGAKLLPIEVPLIDDAGAIGRETAQRVLAGGRRAVFLASSDLTHYGPAYHFMPAGVGVEAIAWAKENDRRLLRLVTDFAVERIVPEVRERMNACGGGAIAAMLAACREAGASSAGVLRHANSYETLAGLMRDDPTNAVGYAAVVVR